MKKVIFLAVGVAAIVLSSCVGMRTSNAVMTTSFDPDNVRLNLTMSDFKFIGKTDISVSSTTYFGAIKVVNDINGKVPSERDYKTVDVMGRSWHSFDVNFQRALWDAKQQFPDADIFVPFNITYEVHNMFMGRRVKQTMTVKAFTIKHE